MLSTGKNVVESIFRIFEFLIVRDKSAGLYGKDEVYRRSITPGLERLNGREAIKAVVQFKRVKVADIVGEHPGSRRLWRIERAYPVLIVIAGGADANVASHAA